MPASGLVKVKSFAWLEHPITGVETLWVTPRHPLVGICQLQSWRHFDNFTNGNVNTGKLLILIYLRLCIYINIYFERN